MAAVLRAEVAGESNDVTQSTGALGYGMHEHLLVGVYHPYGFGTPEAVAP